jgi:hypothetical protein
MRRAPHPFHECMESLQRDFPKMSYKERLRYCAKYVRILRWM